MGSKPNWTKEEIEYLEDKWGVISIKAIAKNLGRGISAVKQKGQSVGLGDPILHYDGISISQLSQALNLEYQQVQYWITNYSFPAKRKMFAEKMHVLVVQYQDFWVWAEEHKQMLNFSRLEPLILGPEPEWVAEKRKADMKSHNKIKVRQWSKEDDRRLSNMVHAYQYTYPEIANRLQRTESALKRRLYDLGIKARPLSLNNMIKYTDQEVQQMIMLYEKGYGLNSIAESLNKSALGVRGKLERLGYKFRCGVPTVTKEA
jgi:transposase-like protein